MTSESRDRWTFRVICAAWFLAGFNFAAVIVEYAILGRSSRAMQMGLMLALNVATALFLQRLVRAVAR